jgi:hypothetical protein
MLRFPLRVGLTWSDRVKFQPDRVKFQPPGMQIRLEDAKYEVQAWEKIKTSKGEFDAFKIVMTMRAPGPKAPGPGEIRTHTYYYLLCAR